METLKMLDSAILAFFTKIIHRVQIVTGKTNFFLAKLALCAVTIDVMILIFNYWFPLLGEQTNAIGTVLCILVFLLFISMMTKCDQAEQAAQSNNPTKFMIEFPPFVRFGWILCVSSIVFPTEIVRLMDANGIFIFKFWSLIGSIGFVAFIYLVNVHPLPPGKSKVREWIKSFAAGFAKLAPLR